MDLYGLHYVFIPKINDRLKSFLEGWNNHSVSTANHQTPSQMFISGLLPHGQLQHSNEVESDNSSQSDSETPHAQPAALEPVSVPRCSLTPCSVLTHAIENIDPLSHSDTHGCSMYTAVIHVCGEHLNNGCDECTC